MGSSKINSQSQGHVTSDFMRNFLKKKHNKNITWQHRLLDLVYSYVYYVYISQCIVYTVNYFYEEIQIEKFF